VSPPEGVTALEFDTLGRARREEITVSLGFGLLSAQLRPGETDWSRAYDETVRLATEAERLGMSSVWTTEHHFVDDGYMPSLLVVSGAIAAATTTIEIGTGVILAPLHHPLRLAEDAATVSLLSGGRLLLGLGLGWSDVEFAGLGADRRLRGRAMEDILEILPKAWTGEPFRHAGKVYDLPQLAIRPAPAAPIPILIGGSAEPAIRRAARLADGIFANAPAGALVQQIEWIRDECERNGRDPSSLRIVHYSVMLPGISADDAWDRYGEHVWMMTWKYSDMEASATRPGPPPAPPPLTDEARARLGGRRPVLAGPPEQIAATLLDLRRRAGVPIEFVARSYFHTLGYEEQVELMEQLAAEVAPHL
jgi:probable F420-dependent oxidoreductase